MKTVYFIVEEGCYSPRDKCIGWRVFNTHAPENDSAEAEKTAEAMARRDARKLLFARVIRAQLVMEKGTLAV